MLTEQERKPDRVMIPRGSVTKWMVLSSPFACALGYLLLK
jgi:hypothetical protein